MAWAQDQKPIVDGMGARLGPIMFIVMGRLRQGYP